MNNLLKWEQTLFKDSGIFELDYVPDVFLYRDTQLKSIGYAIAPGIAGKRPQNIICVGPPGTGKTTTLTKIIGEAKEIPDSNLILADINCRDKRTHYSVLAGIYEKITGIKLPLSGIALKRLHENIGETLAAKNKSLFVIMDDADFLLLRGIFHDVVNNTLRLYEEYPVKIGLCTVHSVLCPPVDEISVFIPSIIKFPAYTWDEIFDILDRRVRIGLYPNVVEKGIIEKITDSTVPKGDIRFGIDLLRRSVINAERRFSRTVDFADVDAALAEASKDRLERYLKAFTDTETALLKAASEMGTSYAGELFNVFHTRTKKGYTTFHKALNRLIEAKLVDTYIASRGKNGRKRIISVKQPILY